MLFLLPWTLALGAPAPIPSCHAVREALRTGAVRLEDEALYVRSLGLGCEAAAAALGTLETDAARAVLAERSPRLGAYGLLHDRSDAGLAELLQVAATDPLWVVLKVTADHPLAAVLPPGREPAPEALQCVLDDDLLFGGDAVHARLLQAMQGDPGSEAWLWARMAEPEVRAVIPQVLALLSPDPEERAALRSWAAWILTHQRNDEQCVDAWGRVEHGRRCEAEKGVEWLPIQMSPSGRWWFDGRAVVDRESGMQVAELPTRTLHAHWSADEELLVASELQGGALWFVWPEEGRVREVRPLFASAEGVAVHEDHVETGDATYDRRTGDLRRGARQAFTRLASFQGGTCSSTTSGFVWCERQGRPTVLLEGRPLPYADGWDTPMPRPIRGGTVSADGRWVAVVHPEGDVDMFDLRAASQEGSRVEDGWPLVLPATWSAEADAGTDAILRVVQPMPDARRGAGRVGVSPPRTQVSCTASRWPPSPRTGAPS